MRFASRATSSWVTVTLGAALAACSQAAVTEPAEDFDTVAIPVSPPKFGFGNGAPSGAHYNLDLIGVSNVQSVDMNGGSDHRIFVKLTGKTRILMCESGVTSGCEDVDGFQILDADGTDGRASFALPNPELENNGTNAYEVYVQAIGQLGGTTANTTCGMGAGEDGILGTADDEELCSVFELELKRKGGKSRFTNVSDALLYVWIDRDGDGQLDRVPLFDDALQNYFWYYDDNGSKLAQFRFYPMGTPPPPSAACSIRNVSSLAFVGDFESGDLTNFEPHATSNVPSVVTNPIRSGSYALQSALHRWEDEVSYRTEVEIMDEEEAVVGDEQWFGFSSYLPDSYVPDPVWELIAQWHARADYDIGEKSRNPVIAIETTDGIWNISVRWDSKENTYESGERVYDGDDSYDLGPYETGRWVDWVFHIKWSYGDDGILQVWKDGELVIDRLGGNTYNDVRGPYLAFGIYKGWKDPSTPGGVDSRVVYHDELRVGRPDATYCDVAP